MSITIDHLLVESGTLYPTTYGKTGGTLIKGTGVKVNSRLRDIDQVQDAPSNPFINSQAMLWLPAGTTVKLEDIYKHSDDREYRISEITHAKRGGRTEESFVKCLVERFVA